MAPAPGPSAWDAITTPEPVPTRRPPLSTVTLALAATIRAITACRSSDPPTPTAAHPAVDSQRAEIPAATDKAVSHGRRVAQASPWGVPTCARAGVVLSRGIGGHPRENGPVQQWKIWRA